MRIPTMISQRRHRRTGSDESCLVCRRGSVEDRSETGENARGDVSSRVRREEHESSRRASGRFREELRPRHHVIVSECPGNRVKLTHMHACGFISPIPVAVRREMHQRRVPLLTGSSRAPYRTATPSPAQSRSIDPLFGRVETELDSSMDRPRLQAHARARATMDPVSQVVRRALADVTCLPRS